MPSAQRRTTVFCCCSGSRVRRMAAYRGAGNQMPAGSGPCCGTTRVLAPSGECIQHGVHREEKAMPRRIACFLMLVLLTGFGARLSAQDRNDPLTDDEVQQIRDNKTNPNERIKLYMKFLDQRLAEIRQLAADPAIKDRSAQIRDKFEEFTRLCDELQDN